MTEKSLKSVSAAGRVTAGKSIKGSCAPSGRLQAIKKDFSMYKSVYVMFIPVLIYYILFHYLPMYGAIIAFKDFSPRLGFLGSPWVGFQHFVNFFTRPTFFQVLMNTVRISFSTLVFGFPAPILLALLMNEMRSRRLCRIVQNITYMPHFISMVIVCGMIKTFTADTGIINDVIEFFGGSRTSLLGEPKYFTSIYVISGIWQEIGWGSIIYLAAIIGVDESLYEAATIDGAGRWKQTLYVTLPGISTTIIVMLILRIGSILSVGYEKIILLYNDATLNVADVISTYVYRKGLLELDWGFSTAVGLFNSVINCLFLFGANFLSKKFNEVSLW